MTKCAGIAASTGDPCKKPAKTGSDYCHLHGPSKAQALSKPKKAPAQKAPSDPNCPDKYIWNPKTKKCIQDNPAARARIASQNVPKIRTPSPKALLPSDSPARGIPRKGQTSKSSPPKDPTLKRLSPSPKPSLPRVRVSPSPLKGISPTPNKSPSSRAPTPNKSPSSRAPTPNKSPSPRAPSPKKSPFPKKPPYSAELITASHLNDIKTVKDLLRKGYNPDSAYSTGLTALNYAIDNGNIGIVKLLLNAGANPNALYEGSSPLYYAIMSNNPQVVELLLRYKADLNVEDNGSSLLYLAIVNASRQVIKVLLDARANPDSVNSGNGLTPLMLACGKGKKEIVKLLLKAGANPDPTDPTRMTPLMLACRKGRIEIVKLLLSLHVEPDRSDMYGWTALSYTIENPIPEPETLIPIIKVLLDAGADPNVIHDGSSILYYAIMSKNPEPVVKLLLEAGADPNVEDDESPPVLQYAIEFRNLAIIRYLLIAGANPNAIGKQRGYTALTTRNISAEITKLLLEAGADPNLMDGDGNFPLSYAVRNREILSAEFLLKAGANPNDVNRNGDTPLSIAYNNSGRYHMVELLLSAGADPNTEYNGIFLLNSRSVGDNVFLHEAEVAEIEHLAEQLLLAGAEPTDRSPPEVVRVIEKLTKKYGSLQNAHEHWKEYILPEWSKWKLAIPGRNTKAAGRR